MPASEASSSVPESVPIWDLLLGVAYVAAGVALFGSLLVNSIELIAAVLGSLLLLIVLSLGTVIRREGILTRENAIIGICVLAAMGLLFALPEWTTLSSELVFVVVFVVGVLVPHFLVTAFGEASPE